ncbi:hypothetical protein [Rhizobium sp. AG855]|uniref:dTMP kinase n=1 Tax=Rhizobium sp. AG855 TaxID=2183898 RepID=UPI000E7447F3|nr:hypothetical protein [Rhizobium sp. AG855]RKE76998.1 thymidylate kinase [Rhizobium sp. AG855]
MKSQVSFDVGHWGLIVALEGPSGVGKSTLLAHLGVELSKALVPHRLSSNNNVGSWGPIIRGLASNSAKPFTLALATAAARAEMRESQSQTIVISDRYVLSSFVYQGYAGVPREELYNINSFLLRNAVTFVIDLDEAELAARRNSRGSQESDWFKRSLTIKEEIELYRLAAELLATRKHIVFHLDGRRPPGELAAEVRDWVVANSAEVTQ